MSRSHIVISSFFIAAMLTLSGCICPKDGESSGDGIVTQRAAYINDDQLNDSLRTKVEKMLAEERLTPVPALVKQLREVKPSRVKVADVTQPAPGSESDLYSTCRKSVMVVVNLALCGKCSKLHNFPASGYMVSADGVMVTNYHVMNQGTPNCKAIVAADCEGNIYNIKTVLAANEKDDIAVVQLDGDKFTPAPIARELAGPGSKVHLISHPQSNFYYFSSGFVSRYFLEKRNPTDQTPARRVAITADYGGGSSGAPLFNSRGEVIGMVASTRTVTASNNHAKQESVQMVLHNCVPVESIVDLLNGTQRLAAEL